MFLLSMKYVSVRFLWNVAIRGIEVLVMYFG